MVTGSSTGPDCRAKGEQTEENCATEKARDSMTVQYRKVVSRYRYWYCTVRAPEYW